MQSKDKGGLLLYSSEGRRKGIEWNGLLFRSVEKWVQSLQFIMSIIRQVSWDQFTKIIGLQQFNKFTSQGTVVVLFVTQWSFPSRLALKRIKKMHFDKKRCGVVDVDLVDSIDLIDQYSITSVPFCLLFKNGEQITHANGFRVELYGQIFGPLIAEYKGPKTVKPKNCPQGHNLQIRGQLQPQIYVEGYFYCNQCRRIQKCSKEKPVAHCQQCDYDLCMECHSSL